MIIDPAKREALKARIAESLAAELGDAYDCGRVWEAWSYGTMGPDDFIETAERADEIAEAVLRVLDAEPVVAESRKARLIETALTCAAITLAFAVARQGSVEAFVVAVILAIGSAALYSFKVLD